MILHQRLRVSLLLLIVWVSVSSSDAAQFFVSPTGSDTNPGTFDLPFLTITKAMSLSSTVFQPGDTIYLRGGTYTVTATITISKTGTNTARYCLYAYPGERALFDCSSMAYSSNNRGIYLSGSYWHIRGIDIKSAGDNGIYIKGSNNVVEFCSFFENRDTGCQLGGGASYNRIINCDSYFNADSATNYGNADGFSPKMDVGTGNYFLGCRSWENADDGWDGYLRSANDVTTTLEQCWTFRNGYIKDGTSTGTPPYEGNGNGFKTGGSDTANLMHNVVLKRCLAFDNRVKGFDQNHNRGSIIFYNCSAYRNGSRNYSVTETLYTLKGKVLTVINCLAMGAYGSLLNSIQQTNSWPGFTVDSADFVSLDTTGVRGPRKSDGSLPDVAFMHLAATSPMVNAGTVLPGILFNDAAPDLGCFETGPPLEVKDRRTEIPLDFQLLQNYPNPFNPTTTIQYSLKSPSSVRLDVFDVLGRKVATLVNEQKPAGMYTVRWDASHASSGLYFSTINVVGENGRIEYQKTQKMLLVQ
jgi:hypothetical protein